MWLGGRRPARRRNRTTQRYVLGPNIGVASMLKGGLLWLIGIPLPIILLLWLFGFLN
jgi:hypothetical protein